MVALTIDASVGGASSNSYVTEDEAETYFLGHVNSNSWDSSDQREELLVYSTNLLDQYVDWDGFKKGTDENQSLEWPRTSVTGVLDTVIPKRVKHAIFELILYIATNGTSMDSGEVKKIKVGPLTIDLDSDAGGFIIPEYITRILSPIGSSRTQTKNGIMQPTLVR